jgi:alkanesulfonate monooxygenase SsuD/methylene tetrahydromethanopterin reductase-like flavin-dependent oxidoreductase (luciferase family)
VPPPEKALRYLEEYGSNASGRRGVIGDPDQVRAGVEEVAHAYGAGEVIAVTITFDHEARRRSYELLAQAFGLGGDGSAAERAAGDLLTTPSQVAGPDDA